MTTISILDITVGSGQCEGEHPRDSKVCLEPLTFCEECGSTHPSEEECPDSEHPVHKCHVCGTPVVWVKNPENVRRKRKLSPADALGREMLKTMGINNFQTAAQVRQWKEFIEVIPEHQIRETWEGCRRNMRKHGWLKYTMNKLNWLIDNGKVDEVVDMELDPGAEYVP